MGIGKIKNMLCNLFSSNAWTGNFLSNVLGVIVGIAITFGVSYLIQQHNEKKQIHQMMTLVREEIAINKEELKGIMEDFLQTQKAYGIFLSSKPEWKTMPEDTLKKYFNQARRITSYGLRSTAWNLFQNSDVIKNFENKELIMFLSSFYLMVAKSENLWENFLQEKMEKFNAYIPDKNKSGMSLSDCVDLIMIRDRPSFLFMDKVYRQYSFDNSLNVTVDHADYALYLIDRSGDYQYKFNIYENFEKFRKDKNIYMFFTDNILKRVVTRFNFK